MSSHGVKPHGTDSDQSCTARPLHAARHDHDDRAYNLRIALSTSTTESNGRSYLFIGAVSSGLVALAFVGQTSHLGTAFFMFGLVVLAALILMGLITFERILQAGNLSFLYARGINRIRHLYLDYAPEMQPYFVLSSHDDVEGALADLGVMDSSPWQVFLTMAGMVGVITSVLAGSFVGLLLGALAFPCGSTSRPAWSLSWRVWFSMRTINDSNGDGSEATFRPSFPATLENSSHNKSVQGS